MWLFAEGSGNSWANGFSIAAMLYVGVVVSVCGAGGRGSCCAVRDVSFRAAHGTFWAGA